jgi:hypothetical protein
MGYFGQLGVDPRAVRQNDGLSNLQKCILGSNPNQTVSPDNTGSIQLQVYTPLK